jgi:hypothetical protein
VGFLERDFERDHLAEKSNRTKMGQKIHCMAEISTQNNKKVDNFNRTESDSYLQRILADPLVKKN